MRLRGRRIKNSVLNIDLTCLQHVFVELCSGQLDFTRGQVWRLQLGLKTWPPPSRHSQCDHPASVLFESKSKETGVLVLKGKAGSSPVGTTLMHKPV